MKKFLVLLLVCLTLVSAALAQPDAGVIELGPGLINFRMQLIDAAADEAVPSPVIYVDVAYESRLEDKSVQSHLDSLFDLMSLTRLEKDGQFDGLKAISYESNPITEYPERLNTQTHQWKAFLNAKPVDMTVAVNDGDLLQIVYTDSDAVPEATDDALANKYHFQQNTTVCYDFTMALRVDEQITLAEGSYKLYVPAERAAAMKISDLIEAVAADAQLEYYFDGASVSIGDYIAEQDAQGNYHYWYRKDPDTGYTSSLGLGGDWGAPAGAGANYEIWYR